jgi:hypothetical protein
LGSFVGFNTMSNEPTLVVNRIVWAGAADAMARRIAAGAASRAIKRVP